VAAGGTDLDETSQKMGPLDTKYLKLKLLICKIQDGTWGSKFTPLQGLS